MRVRGRIAILFFAMLFLLSSILTGCGSTKKEEQGKSNKLKIVATDYAPYDFARQVAGDAADVSMLLSPGEEAHSFEPTPRDMIKIRQCDVFVYTGGESEEWVTDILKDLDTKITVVKLMDCVDLYEEESVEGMESDGHDHSHEGETAEEHAAHAHETDENDHDHEGETAKEHAAHAHEADEDDHDHGDGEEPEYDEHVWTAPANAIKITKALGKAFAKADPSKKAVYDTNTEGYVAQLNELDQAFWDVVNHAKRKTLIFGDRFPLRYFVEEYGLRYYAAFPGCASDTEPSAKTVVFLIDKVKEEKIPVVFHVEFSNESMADTICEDTGAKKLQFNACHNISKEQFQKGVSYLDLMWDNVEVLKEALQ